MVRRLIAVVAFVGLAVPLRAQHRSSAIRTAAVIVDLSYLSTDGNSSSSTLSVSERVNLKTSNDQLRFGHRFDFTRSKTGGNAGIERYGGQVRFDYRLARNFYAMTSVGWDKDTRAGIRSRWAETVGIALEYSIAQADIMSLEAGITAFQQRDVVADPGGLDGHTVGGHLAGRYQHIFSKDTHFGQSLQLIPNFTIGKGYRVVTESEATARVSQLVSLKLQYLIQYSHRPGLVPGSTTGERLATTDRLFLAGLSFSF